MRELTSALPHFPPAVRQRLMREAGITLAAGTVLAILAPWGTRYIGWPWIWMYWTGLIAFGWGAVQASSMLVRRWSSNLRPLMANLVIGAIASVPITIAVQAVGYMMFNFTSGAVSWVINYFYVGIITAIMITLGELVRRARAGGPDTPNPAPGPAPVEREPTGRADVPNAADDRPGETRFTPRLPWHLQQAQILAVASEDHYIRVYTDGGDCLILMRLADAICELDGLEGMRVHRSWWVARAGIAASAREGARITLTLTNGTTTPVSRTYAPAVREAGWLADKLIQR